MINDDNKTEIIDKYLEGSLDLATRQEVEQKMQEDEAFREEVSLQQRIIQAVRKQERAALKQELSDIFEQENDKVRVLSKRNIYYAVAASILLVVAAGIFLWINTANSTVDGVLAVQLVEGARGELPANIPDQVPTLIFKNEAQYNFHYQFGDTLKLYGNFSLEQLQLAYEPNHNNYRLLVDDESYPIQKNKAITPLLP
ncbi:hypothetical protein PZB74_03785 [Porifericola rhodea]|uniref:anti-sigma factor family protein n=1 Tax=Porifericola rhodea TaxID=930972 RepID=UPI002666A961|nr:hypothetical protein [Porifericola rhodea]WKN32467.1 hypothetical protein PZB74_03785 [Porifericola rhodea]